MQILENNSGSSHFYTNIELGPQEDAATITERLIAEFTKDGIYPVIEKNTIAFTSDSANVVAGVKDGVGKAGGIHKLWTDLLLAFELFLRLVLLTTISCHLYI